MPVTLECATAREYGRTERVIDAEKARARLTPVLQRRLGDLLGGGSVMDDSVTVTEEDGAFCVTLHAECEEQIGRTVEFAG